MAAKLKIAKETHLSMLNRALEAFEVALNEENLAEYIINQHLEMVERKYSTVLTASENFMNKLSGENPEFIQEIEDMDKLQNEIIRVKHNAKLRLKQKEVQLATGSTENQALSATLELIGKIQADNAADKGRKSLLPAIELPKFSGNIEKYEEFIESYEAIIQNHPGIEDVEKFIFLKNHLEPRSPAADLLAGFATTSAEYPAALKLFKDTYGDKSLLTQIRISKLLNVSRVDSRNSTRSVYNQLTTHIRSLEGLGMPAEDFSCFLAPIVLSKLPKDMVKRWYLKNNKSVNELLEFLHNEVRGSESATYLEEAFANKSSPRDVKKPWEKKSYDSYDRRDKNLQGYRRNSRPETATSLHASTNNKKCCAHCDKTNHETHNCYKLKSKTSYEIKEFLRSKNLCFLCMQSGHSVGYCPSKEKFRCKTCNLGHNTLLHYEKKISDTGSDQDKSTEQDGKVVHTTQMSTTTEQCMKSVIFQTANAYMGNAKGQRVRVKIMFDPGSDRSYVRKEICKHINLDYHEEMLNVTGYGGKNEGAHLYKVRHAVIQPIYPSSETRSIELVETDKICSKIHREALPYNLFKCKYLRRIRLADDYTTSSDDEIDVLIGLNYYWSFVTGKVKRQINKPIAVESVLGWILQHDFELNTSESNTATSLVISTREGQEINKQLKKFWEIEEVENSENISWSKEETEIHARFKETITHEKDGKYQVRLLLKNDIDKLNSYKSGAISRYQSLIARLERNPDLGIKYREALGEFLENGFAEKVEEQAEPKMCYYLPHHPVINESKATTKVRPVFEGNASEKNSKSLNDYLFKGPPLQPHLNAVLMRFRQNPIALVADVKKMFLMIKVHPADRDWLRFFWEDPVNGTMSVFRLTVLPFGLTCSPYLAIATIHHHVKAYEKEYPKVVRELKENTYVDDQLSGAASIDEAISNYKAEMKIMKDGGMELRKWMSNNPEVMKQFIADEVGADDAPKKFDVEQSILGICWNRLGDYFTFQEKGILSSANNLAPTKRNVLKVAGTLYDPPGLMSPFIIRIKVFIQQLWLKGFDWDELMPEDFKTKWEQWKSELELLSRIKIPRYIGLGCVGSVSPVELHTFGDASESAYASAVYMKSVDVEGTPHVTLMYSKTRVAPLKAVSLPRLELLAAVLAAKSAAYVVSSLHVEGIRLYMWTDSQVTLHWIRGSSRQYKTFVANRIQLIHQLTDDPNVWGWCPGEDNPADIPSRGCPMESLIEEEKWWKGPKWLLGSSEHYPKKVEDMVAAGAVRKEMKKTNSSVALLSTSIGCRFVNTGIIDPKRYSTLKRLLRVTAYMNRFIYNVSNEKNRRLKGPLSAKELSEAEIQWLRCIQVTHFPGELERLLAGKMVKKTSKLVKLTPLYDKETKLIKMGGRIEYANIMDDEKHPIILPSQSYVVKLIVEDIHRRQLHAGINQTLICVRDKYWILRSRQIVRAVVKKCLTCRKLNPVRLQVQPAPLPMDRITESSPFERVGIDFTGPLYVYERAPRMRVVGENKRKVLSYEGVACNKAYICLYTCAVTRAVHLELVPDLTSAAFVRSFRRFTSTRGMCRTIYSDNANTFKRAEKDLKFYLELMNSEEFHSYLSKEQIKWKFILEDSPWWGGFYERLMRIIKTPLKKILGNSRMHVDEMGTVLKEVEAQVNSRPLCSPSDEPSEQNYLTPACFLIGKTTMNMPLKPRENEKITSTQRELNKMLKNQNRCLDTIWKTWREEYLRNLGVVHNKINENACVREGELVLVADHSLPRTVWKVGVVAGFTESKDGRIRRVSIRTANGTRERSIYHLSRLEADCKEDNTQYSC